MAYKVSCENFNAFSQAQQLIRHWGRTINCLNHTRYILSIEYLTDSDIECLRSFGFKVEEDIQYNLDRDCHEIGGSDF